ncbi:MAG: hypothetical protein J3K34DRAFT_438250 [Monoraphidium minutum]|nr:MAG: hypothetical protein J3K34DRAFT_438250 [Monoraphidium minutum]
MCAYGRHPAVARQACWQHLSPFTILTARASARAGIHVARQQRLLLARPAPATDLRASDPGRATPKQRFSGSPPFLGRLTHCGREPPACSAPPALDGAPLGPVPPLDDCCLHRVELLNPPRGPCAALFTRSWGRRAHSGAHLGVRYCGCLCAPFSDEGSHTCTPKPQPHLGVWRLPHPTDRLTDPTLGFRFCGARTRPPPAGLHRGAIDTPEGIARHSLGRPALLLSGAEVFDSLRQGTFPPIPVSALCPPTSPPQPSVHLAPALRIPHFCVSTRYTLTTAANRGRRRLSPHAELLQSCPGVTGPARPLPMNSHPIVAALLL